MDIIGAAVEALGHIYQPIEPGEGFRVLILQPAKELADELVCNLIHAGLNDHPEYEALSYVWGERSDPGTVTLDGQKVEITRNLESALCYLRKKDKPRYLWVDALCIHQQNLDERSKHVQYMSEIYRHCKTDLLWIGSESSIIDSALEAMGKLGDLQAINEEARQNHYAENNVLREMKSAVETLFYEADVWRRVWIVQEVAFAPDVLLVAGHSTFPWEQVENF